MMLRKTFSILAAGAFLGLLVAPMTAQTTVTGSVIDVACHTKQGAKSLEAAHANGCGMACAKKGQPMALVTDAGVYEITGDYTAENNKKLLEFVGKKVEASGEVAEKDGKKTIKVASMKAAATS